MVAVDSSLCVKWVIQATVKKGSELVGWVPCDRRLEDGRYAREVPSGTVAKLRGVNIPVQLVQMYIEKALRSHPHRPGNQSCASKRRMKRRWWAEKLNEELKALGLEDCSCLGKHSVKRWAGLVMLMYTLLAHIRGDNPKPQGKVNSWKNWQKVGGELAKVLVKKGRKSCS